MGRRRKVNSIKSVHKKMSEGRGSGTGDNYIPGIFTYEIPSKGKVSRIKGNTSKRIHHCLSQIEKNFFILLDNDPLVTEIQEQKPLCLEDTLLIAAELGYEHPRSNDCAVVMTTDFLFSKNGKFYAVAIKPKKDICKKRIKEKLEIEKIYWEQKNIQWSLVTEEDIPKQLVINLQWLNSGECLDKIIPDQKQREVIINSFLELYQNPSIPFSKIIDSMEEYYSLIPGTIVQLFKHLIQNDLLYIDLRKPINWKDPRIAY